MGLVYLRDGYLKTTAAKMLPVMLPMELSAVSSDLAAVLDAMVSSATIRAPIPFKKTWNIAAVVQSAAQALASWSQAQLR